MHKFIAPEAIIMLSAIGFRFVILLIFFVNVTLATEPSRGFEKIWNDVDAIRLRLEPDQRYLLPDETFSLLKRIDELGKANDEELELIKIYYTEEEDCSGKKLDHLENLRTLFRRTKLSITWLINGNVRVPKARYMTQVLSNYHQVCDKLFERQLNELLNEKITEEKEKEIFNIIGTFQQIRPKYLSMDYVNIETNETMLFQRGALKYLQRNGPLSKKLMLDRNQGKENFIELFKREILEPCETVLKLIKPLLMRFIPVKTKVNFDGVHDTEQGLLEKWWMIYRACKGINRKDGVDLVYDYWIERHTNIIQRGYFKLGTGIKDKKPPIDE